MKKRKTMNKVEEISSRNPVARFACQFNKAQVFCDKSKYRRHAKHSKQEASLFVLTKMKSEVACLKNLFSAISFKSAVISSPTVATFDTISNDLCPHKV